MTSVPPRKVPLAKLTDYLLNPLHEIGGPKAAFFQAFGFSADGLDVMVAALIRHPDHNPIETTSNDAWGKTFVVRCGVETPDGRNPCIRTVWILPAGESEARLVTAFPSRSQ